MEGEAARSICSSTPRRGANTTLVAGRCVVASETCALRMGVMRRSLRPIRRSLRPIRRSLRLIRR